MGFNISLGGAESDTTGYTVKRLGSCTYVVGSISLEDMGRLLKGRKNEFASNYLAKHFGATLFFGPQAEIDALTNEVMNKQGQFFKAAVGENPSTELLAKSWLKYGDVGASSKFMCEFLAGMLSSNAAARAPLDYDDFQRCEKMLDCIPQFRAELHKLSQFKAFENLVPKWPELSKIHKSIDSEIDKAKRAEILKGFSEKMKA